MAARPTCVVAASKDKALARKVQRLFACPAMRVNTTTGAAPAGCASCPAVCCLAVEITSVFKCSAVEFNGTHAVLRPPPHRQLTPSFRIFEPADVIGVEICGSLKNVLAIAAGIVEGLELGPNAMAALVAQGCAEIRWLATKMGAKAATISGLSGA
jgi:glycerol-3-phosphate dehydrogenase